MRCVPGWRAGRSAKGSLPAHRRAELRQAQGDLGPRADPGLYRQPVVVAEGGAKPLVNVAQPDRVAAGSPPAHARELPGINAGTVVLDRDDGLVAAVFRGNLQPGRSGKPLKAVPDGVLHQWLKH